MNGGLYEIVSLARVSDEIEMAVLRVSPSTNGQEYFQITAPMSR